MGTAPRKNSRKRRAAVLDGVTQGRPSRGFAVGTTPRTDSCAIGRRLSSRQRGKNDEGVPVSASGEEGEKARSGPLKFDRREKK